jgi:hypothetical protein
MPVVKLRILFAVNFNFAIIHLHNAAPNWVGKRIGNLGQLLSTPPEANIG